MSSRAFFGVFRAFLAFLIAPLVNGFFLNATVPILGATQAFSGACQALHYLLHTDAFCMISFLRCIYYNDF